MVGTGAQAPGRRILSAPQRPGAGGHSRLLPASPGSRARAHDAHGAPPARRHARARRQPPLRDALAASTARWSVPERDHRARRHEAALRVDDRQDRHAEPFGRAAARDQEHAAMEGSSRQIRPTMSANSAPGNASSSSAQCKTRRWVEAASGSARVASASSHRERRNSAGSAATPSVLSTVPGTTSKVARMVSGAVPPAVDGTPDWSLSGHGRG